MAKATILSDESLEKFVSELNLSVENKNFLLERIPHLDLEQRKFLFRLLFQIYLLDLEEKAVLSGIKREEEKK